MAAPLLLSFGAALLLAVLLSRLAARSPLSTSAVFLLVGVAVGPLGFDVLEAERLDVELAAEVALFAVLFADGQHAPLASLRRRWQPPARTLLIGMPLTFGVVTVATYALTPLDWAAAAVVGAVLAPTDPVFASALVGREEVPARLRHLLNVESGLNDGLALPAVLVLVGTAGGDPEGWSTEPTTLLLELGVGLVLGVGLPLVVHGLLRLPGVGAAPGLQPLGPLGLAIVLLGLCELVHANQFLAAFAAGATIATLRPRASESFRQTGELGSELAKGGALVAFGALLSTDLLDPVDLGLLAVAAVTLLVARPLPILLSLLGSDLAWRERLAVAWFGPKGFASLAYAVIASGSGMADADTVLVLVTVTVLGSVLVHTTTDVLVAERLREALGEQGADQEADQEAEERAARSGTLST